MLGLLLAGGTKAQTTKEITPRLATSDPRKTGQGGGLLHQKTAQEEKSTSLRLVANSGLSSYVIYDIWWENALDVNGDGYTQYRQLYADVDAADGGSHNIYLAIYSKLSTSSTWSPYFTTPDYIITGTSGSDAIWVTVGSPNPELSMNTYDFKVEVYEAGKDTVQAAGDPSTNLVLNAQLFETVSQDTPVPLWLSISGNAGLARATLSYTDTTAKTATADGVGAYSLKVSYGWSGTVTPSRTGCAFAPASRVYGNVVTNQTNQDYIEYIVANMKVFLQGPFRAGAMTTTLNMSGLIPRTSDSAYAAATYGYTASTVASIPNTSIVDWLLVELRSDTAGATKVARRAGFLKSDGTVVGTDGVSPLSFTGVSAGNYYVVVRHRNHLSIMSAAAVALSSTSAPYDFTIAQAQAYGTDAMAALAGGAFGMIAGDVNQDGIIKYNLRANDRALIYVRIGGGLVNATVSGYYPEDINLDGVVEYNLLNNDRAIIYFNIGGGSLNATVWTRVPD